VSFGDWLNRKYLEWQLQEGHKRSVKSFGVYLGIPQTTLSEYMNNKYQPKGEYLGLIAKKLGPEAYDILGLERPLPREVDLAGALAFLGSTGGVFAAALEEVKSEILDKGIQTDSPEFKTIMSRIFSKYGIPITFTEKP
jgi:hypothetical protein